MQQNFRTQQKTSDKQIEINNDNPNKITKEIKQEKIDEYLNYEKEKKEQKTDLEKNLNEKAKKLSGNKKNGNLKKNIRVRKMINVNDKVSKDKKSKKIKIKKEEVVALSNPKKQKRTMTRTVFPKTSLSKLQK